MESNRGRRGRLGGSSDPDRPAYDNPVGNKGELAVGNNVRRRRRERPPAPPEGHDSDKVLGQKPPTDKPIAG